MAFTILLNNRYQSVSEIKVTYLNTQRFSGKRRNRKKHMNYEFSKLHQKDHPLGLAYMLDGFGNHSVVGDELRYMKENIYNDTEYYASYHYIKKLLEGVHSRMFYE